MRRTVPLLLVLAGVLLVLAGRERWWAACGLTGYDDPACLRVQSHVHDAVSTPMTLALLVLAIAGLLLPPLLLSGASRAGWALGALLGAGLMLPGAGLTWWALVWPPVLAALAVLALLRGRIAQLAPLGLLLTATPLAWLIVVPGVTGYQAYDASPWQEAVAGLLLVLAAVATMSRRVVDAPVRLGTPAVAGGNAVPLVLRGRVVDSLGHPRRPRAPGRG